MPDDIPVRFGRDGYELCAIGTDYYEPVALRDASAALANGIAAESSASGGARWARGGRSLHAFAGKAGIAGFVSAARVVIGEENVVLCTEETADGVLQACAATGSPQPAEVVGPGVPPGWRCFRGIRPARVPADDISDDALLALVPLPDAVIDLGGGIPLDRAVWLVGHPPSIRILGAIPVSGEVAIDGAPAERGPEGEWTASGWDREGTHTVMYAGLSRKYEIAPAPTSWPHYDAHAANGLTLCGALARSPSCLSVVASPPASLWLLGSMPGEAAPVLPPQGSLVATAVLHFQPIWAVTLDTGRGRRRHAAQLIGPASPPQPNPEQVPKSALRSWCHVLRTAGSDPGSWQATDPDTARLWHEYRAIARSLWRRAR